jgi:hypothetical protein
VGDGWKEGWTGCRGDRDAAPLMSPRWEIGVVMEWVIWSCVGCGVGWRL